MIVRRSDVVSRQLYLLRLSPLTNFLSLLPKQIQLRLDFAVTFPNAEIRFPLIFFPLRDPAAPHPKRSRAFRYSTTRISFLLGKVFLL